MPRKTFHRPRSRIGTPVMFLLQNVQKNPNCFNHADGKGAEAEHFVAMISSI